MNEDEVFVDSLVYGHDADAGEKYAVAQGILAELWDHGGNFM